LLFSFGQKYPLSFEKIAQYFVRENGRQQQQRFTVILLYLFLQYQQHQLRQNQMASNNFVGRNGLVVLSGLIGHIGQVGLIGVIGVIGFGLVAS
jgi:hypothetical protein